MFFIWALLNGANDYHAKFHEYIPTVKLPLNVLIFSTNKLLESQLNLRVLTTS
jgi:hypothetical protein